MTVEFGLGMFAFGMTVTIVGFCIAYYFAMKHHEEKTKQEQESKKRKPWEA